MREYKFRGKRLDNGEWLYGSLIANDIIVGEIVEFNNEYFNTEFWYKVDPATVGQYTGLLDKNGKEIYEGDIVGFMDAESSSNENGYDFEEFYNHGYVAYDAESLRFYFTNRSSVEMDDVLSDDIEVAGNRFDNPELLEG